MSALDKIVAVHQAAVSLTDGPSEEERDAAAVMLANAAFISLSEARRLVLAADPEQVPPHLRELLSLVLAASVSMDGMAEQLDFSSAADWVEASALDARTLRLAGGSDSDAKKPYGDVTYADPGYQSDGKKRYPIDTEAHCRAAWSYINKGSNASAYSSSQLASIKNKIKAACKRFGVEVSDSSDSGSDSKKVAASNIALAAPAPLLEAAAVMHKPLHGMHGHMHVHLGDNHHGPVHVRLAGSNAIQGESTATIHKAFTGAHSHPHVHAGDANHGPMRDAGEQSEGSW
jgi:hypothetical protein